MPRNYLIKEITEETFLNKKGYDSEKVFAVLNNNYIVTNPSSTITLSCFVKTYGEQFGEPISYSLKEGETVYLILYDQNGNIFLKKIMTIIDSFLGQFSYTFLINDLAETGLFNGEIVLNEKTISKIKINVFGNKNIFSEVTLASDNPPPPPPQNLNGIYIDVIAQIKSDIRYISFDVFDQTYNDVLAHFIISEIVSIEISETDLLIFSATNNFVRLSFENIAKRNQANERISRIINGEFIID